MTPSAGIFRTQLPKGFLASGVNCGVRRYRPDLGVVISAQPAVAAGVFTQSTCQAAPVRYCQSLLPADNVRAIVTNSGQANAATGPQGDIDNQTMVEAVAAQLECDANQVLSASTGVIGDPMEMDKITEAMPELCRNTSNIAEKFALAVMTTDLVPKAVMKKVVLSQGEVCITGIAKGSGMIHPNMATMLGYLLTDVRLDCTEAETLLKQVTDNSFNMISVDGDTSTNDTVFLMANGASGVSLSTAQDQQVFTEALQEISILLAKSIARDGEGATKLIEVRINHAPTLDMARKVARGLTLSPLIKTAIYGESPNWGRFIGRLGAEQVPASILEKMSLKFQGMTLFSAEQAQDVDPEKLKALMKQDTVVLEVDMHDGEHSATAWGCDLSERYIKINAEYVT